MVHTCVDAGDTSDCGRSGTTGQVKPLVARSTVCTLSTAMRKLAVTFFVERNLSASGFVDAAMQRFEVSKQVATSMLVHGRYRHYYVQKLLRERLRTPRGTGKARSTATPRGVRSARRRKRTAARCGSDDCAVLIDTRAPWLPDAP